jgi:hypothetical protein
MCRPTAVLSPFLCTQHPLGRVISCVEMQRERCILEQRLKFDNHVHSDCARKLIRIFRLKCLDVTVPNRATIHEIENKLRQGRYWTEKH